MITPYAYIMRLLREMAKVKFEDKSSSEKQVKHNIHFNKYTVAYFAPQC